MPENGGMCGEDSANSGGQGCAACDGTTDAGLWISLAGAGRWRIPRRSRRRERMEPRAIPMTTGGFFAKPPSAGAWSSRCSPAATVAAVMCPRLLVAGSKALKCGPRSWQVLPTALSMEGPGQLWCSEGGDLGTLHIPTGCTPGPSSSTPSNPPALVEGPSAASSLFTWLPLPPADDRKAPELSMTPSSLL